MKAESLQNKASVAPRRRNAAGTPPQSRRLALAVAVLAVPTMLAGWARLSDDAEKRNAIALLVTASAFNSTRAQTDAHPTVSAWGDTLEPGMRAIAVSRDLIPLGLDHGAVVRIEGLEGEYVVRDKMAARWEKRIDIYMGDDIAAAREWGTRKLTIYWKAEPSISSSR